MRIFRSAEIFEYKRIAGLITAIGSEWRRLYVNLIFAGSVLGVLFSTFSPASVLAQTSSLCASASPTSVLGSTIPIRLSHPEYESKGWKVALRTGPSMDCDTNSIWADDNLPVKELGIIVTDQSWSLLEFTHNGLKKQRWAETKFLEDAGGSGGCTGASPSTTFSARSRTLSHPEFESKGWKVMLRTGPSVNCSSDPIWADDNLQVKELGTSFTDQSWSLLDFNHNGRQQRRWAETKFLEGGSGAAGCVGASPSTRFSSPFSRTLSHPEFEAKGWKVMLRTGPSMDCGSDPIWADDNLQVEELGTIITDQSWSLLRFNHNGTSKQRWAETKFLEVAGGSGGCMGASPSATFNPRLRTLSHPEYEAKGWKVMLRTGPSMDCGSNPIWADDNLPVEEIGVYIGVDQSWSLLKFNHNGSTDQRWAETKFLEGSNGSVTTAPTPIDPAPSGVPIVIFDTDMGPDIDDALALAALHAYASQGMAHIAAVTLSRNSNTGARYIDLLNTFYKRPDIPIGVYRGITREDSSEHGYTRDIVNSGKYRFSLDVNRLPQGHHLMRDVLTASPDNSVVIIQVGFSTNTARLLEEYPDLVARKARLLSVMAGDFNMPSGGVGSLSEFNIRVHSGSAKTVFSRWPNEMVVSEFGLGWNVLYPLSSIRNDFNYVSNHPIKDSYLNNTYSWHLANGNSYDMRSWDITSVIAAIEPGIIRKVLGPGRVMVSSSDHTSFSHGGAMHYVLAEGGQLSSAERRQLIDVMIQLTSAPPAGNQIPDSPPPGNPTPTPQTPSRKLAVSITENPLKCDGSYRTVAVVSGFDDSESVVVNVNGTDYPARNATGGNRSITWRCSNGGSTLVLEARGVSSGLKTEFVVETQGPPVSRPTSPVEPVCRPAPTRGYPSREVVIVSPATVVSYIEPLESFADGCRARLGSQTFDEGQRVMTNGYAGGYLRLATGGWIRASAADSIQPNNNPPPGLANNTTASAQALLNVLADEINRSPADEEMDRNLLTECIIFARRNNVSASDLDVSSGIDCVIGMYKSKKNRQWFDDIVADIVNNALPQLDQAMEDLLNNPIVDLLGISDIVRCADGVEGNYCIYAAAGIVPIPAGKLPKAIKLLRSTRVPNRLSIAATRFTDNAAQFSRFCRISGLNSFHKDTLVLTESGQVPISSVKVGDLVLAYDEETGKQSLQMVENLISGKGEKSLVDILLNDGESITATSGHPFYLPRIKLWVEAGDLTEGQLLLDSDGSLLEITRISERIGNSRVFNLTVANDHTYYAGVSGVLNHNANGCKFPKWATRTSNHLRGEFNESGRFVGYHTRYNGKDRAGVRITDRAAPNSKGIYTAKVEGLNENGQWKKKRNRSTFFPDSWDLKRIQDEVNNAYATARMNGQEGRLIQEKSSTGFDILVQVDANNVIIRAHPQL